MLGKEREPLKRIYLTVARGKIERTLQNGAKESYNSLEGYLTGIHSKDRTFGSDTVKYWYLDVRDGEELYSLGFPLHSGVLRSIVLCLASEPTLSSGTPLRFETYERDGFTKVKVFADGVGLDWATKQLPPVRTVVVGGKTVKDETDRNNLIERYISEIQERLRETEGKW